MKLLGDHVSRTRAELIAEAIELRYTELETSVVRVQRFQIDIGAKEGKALPPMDLVSMFAHGLAEGMEMQAQRNDYEED